MLLFSGLWSQKCLYVDFNIVLLCSTFRMVNDRKIITRIKVSGLNARYISTRIVVV